MPRAIVSGATIRRILVENGSYDLSNFGDVAMLQHGVGQLRRRFPLARIDVITGRPDRLARYCPGTRPVSPTGRFLPKFATAGFENLLKLKRARARQVAGVGHGADAEYSAGNAISMR